ncbi:FecR family protein [Chitinophaga skermanii]|uniref:FecR family protein n=1 Tax=Chitinophaga skermanii TaxID=331697 RepID=A0A327R567_9BACT|nr:FecR family protein [Chitinophaga skermanii]RAJ11102.1 FecR family protein [Chitinophaga skermanii]
MDNQDQNKERFILLLKKYREGRATAEETRFLEAYFDVFEGEDELITAANEHEFLALRDQMKANIELKIASHFAAPRKRRFVWIKWAAAAAVFLTIGSSIYFYTNNIASTSNHFKTISARKMDRAQLQLADGSVIYLDEEQPGTIAEQGGSEVTKGSDNSLVYNQHADDPTAPPQMNIFSTPNGKKYKIVLPDGTKVWLNAVSSLRFPTSFSDHDRVVTLVGEAFFDVAKDEKHPFIVKSGEQAVQVLGTQFNINAYEDESQLETTLVTGAVKVTNANNTIVIAPGEKVIVVKDGSKISKVNADVELETAWVNEIFSFKNEDITSIMREIARWYNVNVQFSGKFPGDRYSGEIERSNKLEDVLKILALNNIHFEMQGNTIIVSYDK